MRTFLKNEKSEGILRGKFIAMIAYIKNQVSKKTRGSMPVFPAMEIVRRLVISLNLYYIHSETVSNIKQNKNLKDHN